MRITIDYTEEELESMGTNMMMIPRGQNMMVADVDVRGILLLNSNLENREDKSLNLNVRCKRIRFGKCEDFDGTCQILKQKTLERPTTREVII